MHHVMLIRNNRVISLYNYHDWTNAVDGAVKMAHHWGCNDGTAELMEKFKKSMYITIPGENPVAVQIMV